MWNTVERGAAALPRLVYTAKREERETNRLDIVAHRKRIKQTGEYYGEYVRIYKML